MIRIEPQPDDTTCGPTCLHAVYRHFGDDLPLEGVIADVPALDEGGTLAVLLGTHALRRGYRATIYTYKLQVFDPTWFSEGTDLADRLREQRRHKTDAKLRLATDAYLEFLDLGGDVRMDDLTPALIRRSLQRGRPVLTGLSATYLYRSKREFGPDCDEDDVRGEPVGHFVVLADYDKETRSVHVADPLEANPLSDGHHYSVKLDRLVAAILLGVLTYDAALLVLEPPAR